MLPSDPEAPVEAEAATAEGPEGVRGQDGSRAAVEPQAATPAAADPGLLKERILDSLVRGYSWLYARALYKGHWNEVRSTAVAGICLSLIEPLNSPWLASVGNWLCDRQVAMGSDEGSWGEEVWDTTLAALCLLRIPDPATSSPHTPARARRVRTRTSRRRAVERAMAWIASLFNENGRFNWHDEPWETSLSLLTGLHVRSVLGSEPRWDTLKAFHWLHSLQDDSGRVVAPHYSAYFVEIYELLTSSNLLPGDTSRYREAADKATAYLDDSWRQQVLWSGEPWSNADILRILACSERLDLSNTDRLNSIVGWFISHQDPDHGDWRGNSADTATALLGLYALISRLHGSAGEATVREDVRSRLGIIHLRKNRFAWLRQPDGVISIRLDIRPDDKRRLAAAIAAITLISLLYTFWEQIVSFLEMLF